MWFRVHEDHVAAAQDAIGDILIYMADYCSRRGMYDPKYCEAMFSPDGSRFGVTHSAGLKVWGFEESEAGVESFQIHESSDTGK